MPSPPAMELTIPRDLPNLIKHIDARLGQMSPQFHQVARYFIDNSDEVALAPVRVLAGHIGVHPSTIVRFAKYMSYDGFKEMQLIFKAGMYAKAQGMNSRISRLDQQLAAQGKHKSNDGARNIIASEITSLQTLLEKLSMDDLDRAVKLVAGARVVWVVSSLDGMAVGAHLTRMLTLLPRDARLLEAGSARSAEAIQLAKAGDVVIAIEIAHERSADVLAEIAVALRANCKLIVIGPDPRPRGDGHIALQTSSNNTLPVPTLAGPLTLVHILGMQVANRTNPSRFQLPDMAQFDPLGW
jgi:DNA-binding MurR/RpiR family transcriptional regulator